MAACSNTTNLVIKYSLFAISHSPHNIDLYSSIGKDKGIMIHVAMYSKVISFQVKYMHVTENMQIMSPLVLISLGPFGNRALLNKLVGRLPDMERLPNHKQ